MSISLFNSSLVRLLKDNQSPRNPLGAGCLVSISSRYVLTCAHVVAQVLKINETSPDKPSTPLYLDFPLLPQQPLVQAIVEEWRPVRKNPVVGEIEDIALLKLTSELPENAHPVQLSTIEDKHEQLVKLFGFPSGKLEGVYLDGRLKGMTGKGQVEIHVELGQGNVQGGFSGSPVWNADKTVVLGLLQEVSKYDGTIHTYMIPATTLRQVFGAQIIENPYRGLAAFRQADANVFFGRTGEIQELLRLVKERRFTALVGVSGSGKSSVVFAGLVPQLQESQWQVIECRPGGDPFNHLAVALVKLLTSDKLAQAKQLTTLEKELPTGETKLSALVQVWQEESHKRLLLIIDQFEELYTSNSTVVQQQFMAGLLTLIQSDVPATLLLTLRADFMSQALTYPEFSQALNGNTRFISSMNRDELEEVIEKPAAQVGLRLETGLTKRILEDLGKEEGYLPLLQFALTSLFEKQLLGGLTHEAYTEIGGVKQALVKHAEREFAKFTPTVQNQVRQIFVQLVHPGQGTEDTRRVVIYSQLADKWAVVTKLADNRLVVTGRREKEDKQDTVEVIHKEGKQDTVEVIHEALIRHWPRLQDWMKEDRAFRVWQDEFQVDLQRWQAQKKPRAELLQGAKLAQAEEMLSQRAAELSVVEQAFIKASRQEQRRQQRVWQGVFVLLLVLLGVAGWQWWKATEQARIAFMGKLSTQAILAAQSPSPANGYPDQALLLATQSFQLLNNSNTQGSLSHVLQTTATAHIQKFFHGHKDRVNSVAFSADGKRVISGSTDKTLILWDVVTGQPLGQPWQVHQYGVTSVAFSADGKRVVSGSGDKTLILWDVATGQPLGPPWQGHQDTVNSVAFSADGKRVISGSYDKTLILWDVATGQPIGQPWQGHIGNVSSVAFSANGKRVVSGSSDQTLILWDVATGQPLGQLWQVHQYGVTSVAFSADGKRVISGSLNKPLIFWDVATDQPLGQPWWGHKGSVFSVAFSADGQRIISGSSDHTLILWDVATGQAIGQPWQGHDAGVTSVAFSADGKRVISGSDDGILILWDVATGQAIGQAIGQLWQGHQHDVASVAFSADGQRVISGSDDGILILWDVATGQAIGQPWQGHDAGVTSVAFSADGQRVISGSYDKTLILWDVATGQAIGQPWQGHKDGVNSVAFSADGQRVISGSYDNTLILWDVATGQAIGQPWQGHDAGVTSVAFSADGQRVISGSYDKTLILWDVATGQAIGQPWQGHKNGVNSVAFSADGKRVISGSWYGILILWDVATGQAIGQPWQGHQYGRMSVAFSADGKRVISGSYDKILIFWDVATGQPIGQPWQGHKGSVFSVAFSADGKHVISEDEAGGMILWQADPKEWVKIACRKVNRNFTLAEWTRFLGDRPYEKTCPQFPSGVALARLQEGEELAGQAELPNVEAAIAKFQEAFALEPELQKHPLYRFNPEVEAKKIAALAWVSKGESLASEEKLDEAIATFKQALALDASLKFDPQTKANQSCASALVNKGEYLASEEKLDDAIAAFKQAQALDASLKFDPQTKANQSLASALVDKGESLAREEKLDEAIATFKRAQALDVSLKFDPQTKANQLVAAVLVNKGESLASEGKIDEAIAQYAKAQELDPHSNANQLWASALMFDKGWSLVREGKIDEAIAQYTKAQQLDPHLQVTAGQWNELCWYGATYQQATKVMEACEKAVALDPQDFEYRDSRGLARALTGNVTGAIEDFQFFVEQTKNAYRKAQRQHWIEALRRGENPFTEEVLKELREE